MFQTLARKMVQITDFRSEVKKHACDVSAIRVQPPEGGL